MNRMIAIVSAVLATAAADKAWAQSGSGVEFVQLSPSMTECVKQCLPSPTAPADIQAKALTKRLAVLEKKLAQLKGQVGLLAKKKADAADVSALKGEIAQIRERLETLTRKVAEDVVDLGNRDAALEARLTALTESTAGMNARLAAVEAKSAGVKLDVGAGFIGLWATDGLSYTGIPVTARLKLNLNESVDVNIDAGLLVSFGHQPMGTSVRGGLTFDLNDKWAIEAGLSGDWVGFDNQMKAKAAFVTADGGITFRYGMLRATANVIIGSKFQGQKAPCFALGGAATVGIVF